MKIMGLGLDYTTGEPLIAPMDEQEFSRAIEQQLAHNAAELRALANVTALGTTFRGEVERQPADLGDPRVAGWTFLINGDDPQKDDLMAAIRPLAEHRGMADPDEPLLYSGESPDDWLDWLLENYTFLNGEPPHYILIVGEPEQVPFAFQSILDTVAAVGRVAFDSLDDLRAYVAKIIDLERAEAPCVSREVLFFGQDRGPGDATYFSRHYMVEPLAGYVQDECGYPVQSFVGEAATKERLQEALRGRPALVYTASHGMAAPSQDLETQKRVNGAICCQRAAHHKQDADWLFRAEDVPLDQACLEGSVFFQFACFGYGTPAESDFNHWLGQPILNSQADFISALPKRLLAHPRGPIAYVGHLDTAWLHGFDDPNAPYVLEQWHPRIEPFVRAVDMLLKVNPVGLAMAAMNKRYDVCNALLTGTFDRIQKRKIKLTPSMRTRLASAFITRSDAQNYHIFGDPAARLRIPDQ